MRKKFNEKRRLQKYIGESQEKLLQRARERVSDNNLEFEISPTNREKMSEIIAEYAEPLLDAAKNYEEQKKAISMAISMWNISLMPEEKQIESLKEIENILNPSKEKNELSVERQEVCSFLINRKKQYFHNINRFVQDYEVFETPDGLHLNVASIAINNA